MKYRELSKLKSTYIDALPDYINPHTNRIHTTFSQTQVATGRLASSDPNLQNIPADSGGYGIEIRAAFIPQEGACISYLPIIRKLSCGCLPIYRKIKISWMHF